MHAVPERSLLMEFTAFAPGRVCLFGEHQDYLGLPVIAAAIGLDFENEVYVESPSLNRYKIIMPDIGKEALINTAMPLVYQHKRDYLRSAINVLRDDGIELPKALTATFRSRIPIAAGTSSSTAMSMAWIAALLHAAGRSEAKDPLKIARYSHKSEVLEFNESGGMMDQLSIGFGGICHIDFSSDNPATPLEAKPEGLILGDSQQPKDTLGILSRVRGIAERAILKIKSRLPGFDLTKTTFVETEDAASMCLDGDERVVLLGNLQNRDILIEAMGLLSQERFDAKELGSLLIRHHEILRDHLKISTPKIEAMMDAAMEAGALGGKINGSGGGGCMFVLAPGREKEVSLAIEKAGGTAHPVAIGDGVRISEV